MIYEIVPVNNYRGNNSSTIFDFDFFIEDESQLKVCLIDEQENKIELKYNIDYSINEFKNKAGSYITFPIEGSAYNVLSDSQKISLELSLPISQETQYNNSSLLNLEALEYSFDYLTRLIQIINRKQDRSIKVDEGADLSAEELGASVNKIAKNFDTLSSVISNLNNIYTVNNNSDNINLCADNIQSINNSSFNVQTCIDKASEAQNSALSSQKYALESQIWTQGTNREVEALGGLKSAKGWAQYASSQATGANQNLSNLSSEGKQKITACRIYDSGISTDQKGYQKVYDLKHSQFDQSKITVVGSPIISNDGIASNFSRNNYITLNQIDLTQKNWEVLTPVFNFTDPNVVCYPLRYTYNVAGVGDYGLYVQQNTTGLLVGIVRGAGTNTVGATRMPNLFVANKSMQFKFKRENTIWSVYYRYFVNNVAQEWVLHAQKNDDIEMINFNNAQFQIGAGYGSFAFNGSADLKTVSYIVDNNETYNCLNMGIDIIKPDNYTVVGNPEITPEGILNNGVVYSTYPIGNLKGKSWELKGRIYPGNTNQTAVFKFGSTLSYTRALRLIITANKTLAVYGTVGTSSSNQVIGGWASFGIGIWNNYFDYSMKFDIISGVYTLDTITDTGIVHTQTYTPIVANKELITINENESTFLAFGEGNNNEALSPSDSYNDLNTVRLYADGDLVYQPCLKIPYIETKTGAKIANSNYRNRIDDCYSQFGTANYFTIDETNKNFTLPYDTSNGECKIIKFYRDGVVSFEYNTNLECIETGSCTSGTPVVLAKPMADENYALSIPYNAKTKTGFTPALTGNYIAKGRITLG